MNDLIAETVELISDYRTDDGIVINDDHVTQWINQFTEDDREFLLSELNHILPHSYISKSTFIALIPKILKVISEKEGFDTVNAFLDYTKILSCQDQLKSQSEILQLLDIELISTYNISINDCGRKDVKYWLYLDDVLASGGTFRKNIIDEIEKYGTAKFSRSGIKILGAFLFLHTWAKSNVVYSISQTVGYDMSSRIVFYKSKILDNNPRINFYNSDPRFNIVYPIDNNVERVHAYIKSLTAEKNEAYTFRKKEYPKNETFYSSSQNRNRYEHILLNKGLDIISKITKEPAKSLRPLGMVNPSYKTLGLGSHAFTWRNISNTCPLVFWWETNDWHPLFPVANRGGH